MPGCPKGGARVKRAYGRKPPGLVTWAGHRELGLARRRCQSACSVIQSRVEAWTTLRARVSA
jgi:hypothetical protein